MVFVVAALLAGASIGLAAGGRLSRLGEVSFRAWPALPAGLVLQVAAHAVPGWPGMALLLASYGLLLAFAVANLYLVGMGLIVLGITMNAVVIAANGGMPVRRAAIEAIGADADALTFDAKHHLEGPDDRLTFLGDIIPLPLGPGEVLSFGDLVMAVGVADLVVHLLRGRRPSISRPAPEGSASTGSG